jgi:4a-hydroxytetrahydrobiopterin dehydratase
MADLLTPDAVSTALEALPGWTGDTSALRREARVPDAQQDELVDAVMATADEMDHHPQVERGDGAVTFTLTTHSAGGVTVLDVELAAQIDEVLSGRDAPHD